jgi:hypothetical protein
MGHETRQFAVAFSASETSAIGFGREASAFDPSGFFSALIKPHEISFG